MSRLAQIDEISSPTVGPLGRLPERHPGIIDVTANPRRPDRKVGFIPITLNDPDGSRNLLLEPGLPMARAARAEAWNNEGSGHGVSHEFGLQSALRDTFD